MSIKNYCRQNVLEEVVLQLIKGHLILRLVERILWTLLVVHAICFIEGLEYILGEEGQTLLFQITHDKVI